MRQVGTVAVFAALLAAGACSHSSSGPSSPTSPSVDLSSPSPSVSGATVKGQVQGNSAGPMKVSVLGTAKTASVDSAGRFRLDDVAPGKVELRFEGAGTDVRVGVGDVTARERVDLMVLIAGRSVTTNGATSFLRTTCSTLSAGAIVEVEGATQPDGSVLAKKIQLEDDDEDEDDEDEAEFRGTVTFLDGTCPSLTMTVAGRGVRTNDGTAFERGGCGDVRMGLLLQIKGTPNADGSVTARRVRFED